MSITPVHDEAVRLLRELDAAFDAAVGANLHRERADVECQAAVQRLVRARTAWGKFSKAVLERAIVEKP